MKKTMVKVVVSVSFTGTVEVEVPDDVPQERRETLARKVALARVTNTLGSLISSGVPILESLDISAETAGSGSSLRATAVIQGSGQGVMASLVKE